MLILARVAAIDRLDIEVLENVQDLGDVDAARARWRKADDRPATISGSQRLTQDWLIGGKIVGREQSAMIRHPRTYGSRKWPTIEKIGSVLGNSAVCACQVGLLQYFAVVIGGAVRLEQCDAWAADFFYRLG